MKQTVRKNNKKKKSKQKINKQTKKRNKQTNKSTKLEKAKISLKSLAQPTGACFAFPAFNFSFKNVQGIGKFIFFR